MIIIPVLTFSLAGPYVAKEDSVTVSCDAFTQSAERATFEMRTSSMLPGKIREVPSALSTPPPNIIGTCRKWRQLHETKTYLRFDTASLTGNICGSASTWIINNVLKNRGGLHNRITDQIHLLPFTHRPCRQCHQYLRNEVFIWQIHSVKK